MLKLPFRRAPSVMTGISLCWWTNSASSSMQSLFSSYLITNHTFWQSDNTIGDTDSYFSKRKITELKNQSCQERSHIYHYETEMYVTERNCAHRTHYHMSNQS